MTDRQPNSVAWRVRRSSAEVDCENVYITPASVRNSRNRQFVACLMILFAGAIPAAAQEATGRFVDHTFHDDSGEHKYVVFVPAAYRADKPSPAILFLHGAGERGKENRLPLTEGLAPFIQARLKTFPFVVVIPQCESSKPESWKGWIAGSPDGRRALLALDDAEKRYRVDTSRVVLSGWSMGGYGAWSLGIAEPTRWSAIVPLSGVGIFPRLPI